MSESMPPSTGWTILLEDGPVLAVNKPAGLLTQGPVGVPSLEGQVKEFLKLRFEKPGNVYLGIPHRLDRAVSGVVVFARNSKAAARLAEQFELRQVTKVYWAIVERPPEPAEGALTDWLRKLPEQSRAEVVDPAAPGARECRLNFRTLVVGETGTMLEVVPHTGRMHQIRIQLAARGWPIVGDLQYGSQRRMSAALTESPRDLSIALHARSLTFLHPIRYDPITVKAPLPDNWSAEFRHLTSSQD